MYDYLARVRDLSPSEQILLESLDYIKPETSFRPGDIAILTRAPRYLAMTKQEVPVSWQVRFVISAWAYMAYGRAISLSQQGIWEEALEHYKGDLLTLMDHEVDLPKAKWKTPVIYAHGFPHGEHPDSAAWFRESNLRRMAIRSPNAEWEQILDESRAPYVGIEAPLGVVFDVAPDLYANGENLDRPFSFEEDPYQALCILGYQRTMESRANPRFYTPQIDEPDLRTRW